LSSSQEVFSGVERTPRKRNPRGQGARLRDEIIAGATAVLERTGSEDSVTLRAVAREIGVAPPSIARHFADLPQIIDAVVARELTEMYQTLVAAAASSEEPVERLFRICRAYIDYGRAYPARYGILVGRRFLEDWGTRNLTMEQTAPLMAAAITLFRDSIQACIDAGESVSTDAYFDTLTLWFALHGLVTVPAAITSLDWPDHDQLLAASVTRAAQLTRAPPGGDDEGAL
jgi:AcrR family transcriptional regulator